MGEQNDISHESRSDLLACIFKAQADERDAGQLLARAEKAVKADRRRCPYYRLNQRLFEGAAI